MVDPSGVLRSRGRRACSALPVPKRLVELAGLARAGLASPGAACVLRAVGARVEPDASVGSVVSRWPCSLGRAFVGCRTRLAPVARLRVASPMPGLCASHALTP